MEKGKPNPYSKKKIKQTNGYAICISMTLLTNSLGSHCYLLLEKGEKKSRL